MTRRRKRQYVILPSAGGAGRGGAPASRTLDEIARASHSKSRRELIAEAAYHRAQRRGFRGGDPVEDWLAAEAEIDAMLGKADRR